MKPMFPIAFVAAVVGLGTLLRVVPVVLADFPLNDGALFLTMAEDLRRNEFLLPAEASYNDLSIPYAYPPLAFYLVAVLAATTGIAEVDVLRIVPVLSSLATIPLVYGIARHILPDRWMALASAAIYSVAPRSYEWLIGGGGITRAPALVLALAALLLALGMGVAGRRWMPIAAGAALGAAALCHPEAGVFGALSVVFVPLWTSEDRRSTAVRIGTIAVVALLVVSPWLLTVIALHGVGPLLAARGAGGSVLDGLLLLLASKTGGGYAEVMGIATSVAIVVLVIRRSWMLPAWIALIVLVDPRGGATYVAVPASMAVVLLAWDVGRTVGEGGTRSQPRAAVLAAAMIALAIGVDAAASRLNPLAPLRALSADERAAMYWAASETQADAAFVVISGMPWSVDAEAEWFPALAKRTSVGTVQGHEWIERDQFVRQHRRADELLRCAASLDARCVERWLERAPEADYLFLARSPALASIGHECCLELATLIEGARVAYRNDDVIIVRLGS